MQALLLLLVLLLGVYYQVRISHMYRLILIGFCVYSAVQVANNQFLLLNNAPGDSVFGYIRKGSFLIALAIWTYAVWRWGADSTTPHNLISQSQYNELSPQIHDRLRELNDKLAKLIKP
jgi:type VI protein secretion system component VasK